MPRMANINIDTGVLKVVLQITTPNIWHLLTDTETVPWDVKVTSELEWEMQRLKLF